MSKRDYTLKDLMIELDKIYKEYGDKEKLKPILEAGGYHIEYMPYRWIVGLDNKKFLELEFGDKTDERYFHLAIIKASNPLLDRLKELQGLNTSNKSKTTNKRLKPKYDKTYMTTKNGIKKLITYNTENVKTYSKKEDVENDKDNPANKIWQKIIEREKLNTSQLEHHLIINPQIENYSSKKLFNIFNDGLKGFYRQNDVLGKYFNKKKGLQMPVYITLEYGSKDIRPDEKGTHFHILLKSHTLKMLRQFHPFMKKYLKKHIGEDTNYQYHKVDTPEYRINVYNYMSKEDREVWSNNDLYNAPKEVLDEYDKIILKHCHTTDYNKVAKMREQEVKKYWEQQEKKKELEQKLMSINNEELGKYLTNLDK